MHCIIHGLWLHLLVAWGDVPGGVAETPLSNIRYSRATCASSCTTVASCKQNKQLQAKRPIHIGEPSASVASVGFSAGVCVCGGGDRDLVSKVLVPSKQQAGARGSAGVSGGISINSAEIQGWGDRGATAMDMISPQCTPRVKW